MINYLSADQALESTSSLKPNNNVMDMIFPARFLLLGLNIPNMCSMQVISI